MGKTDIILVYPRLGCYDGLLRDIPLSLLYAAAHSVKNGYVVKILDCRLHPNTWRRRLAEELRTGVKLVGVSVMTGNPITTGLQVSKLVKDVSEAKVVWGGPHPTILAEQTLEHPAIDYVVRDWGSEPLYKLIAHLSGEDVALEDIVGLGYKRDGEIVLNPATCSFEMLDYRDIPYHLVDIDAGKYNRVEGDEFIFPIYTAMGCPYKCSFCMSPHVYKKIRGKKWVPFPLDDVMEHIEYLMSRYDFQRLQIYDDDTFVDIERMREFFKRYIERGYNKKLILDFRGARINELDKMDEEFMELMVEARVELLAIGVESGSLRSLQKMNKGITPDQIRRVGKKLARYQQLRPHYNIMCGVPGETIDDLKLTKELMIEMAEENPRCFIGAAGDWKALPGAVMTEVAQRDWGLKLPETLEEWAEIDSNDSKGIDHPWYTSKFKNYIHLLQLSSFVLDKKLELVEEGQKGHWGFVRLYVALGKLYRPILRFRLKHDWCGFLVEHWARVNLMRLLGWIQKPKDA